MPRRASDATPLAKLAVFWALHLYVLIDVVHPKSRKRPVSDDWERMTDHLVVSSFVQDDEWSAEKIAHTSGNMLDRRMP
ncbi:hypothetical protein [Yoonia sp. R78084]|uniref:hypothetical protein n=1 Tax=Yoonia sp. R78084 TaxID=3093869 RepID=UPI0037DD1A8F